MASRTSTESCAQFIKIKIIFLHASTSSVSDTVLHYVTRQHTVISGITDELCKKDRLKDPKAVSKLSKESSILHSKCFQKVFNENLKILFFCGSSIRAPNTTVTTVCFTEPASSPVRVNRLDIYQLTFIYWKSYDFAAGPKSREGTYKQDLFNDY